MNYKSNRTLAGLIVVAIALYFLLKGTSFSLTPFILIFSGLVLVLLFWTKRQSWALVLGMYVLFSGLHSLISPRLPGNVSNMLFSSALWVVPGITFFMLYLLKNKRGLLVPSMLFTWFGIFYLLSGLGIFSTVISSGGLLVICFGLAFVCAFFIGRDFSKKMSLYTGILLTVCGIIFGTGMISSLTTVFLVVLLISGLLIIFKR